MHPNLSQNSHQQVVISNLLCHLSGSSVCPSIAPSVSITIITQPPNISTVCIPVQDLVLHMCFLRTMDVLQWESIVPSKSWRSSLLLPRTIWGHDTLKTCWHRWKNPRAIFQGALESQSTFQQCSMLVLDCLANCAFPPPVIYIHWHPLAGLNHVVTPPPSISMLLRKQATIELSAILSSTDQHIYSTLDLIIVSKIPHFQQILSFPYKPAHVTRKGANNLIGF